MGQIRPSPLGHKTLTKPLFLILDGVTAVCVPSLYQRSKNYASISVRAFLHSIGDLPHPSDLDHTRHHLNPHVGTVRR